MGVKKYKPKRTPKLLEDRTVRIFAEAKKTVQRGENAVRNSEDLVAKSRKIVDEIRALRMPTTKNEDGEP